MGKLIVNNKTETLDDHECFHYISRIICKGKISKTKGVEHYCHLTTFDTIDSGMLTVYFKLNKSSSTFTVYQEFYED